jgi:2-polyprenyl-6-methoxyphenol hydroxylase-like FAD-dependent oxidoreductase
MATAPPILIAGGGIGGLALALALAQTGRRSVVLEQRDTFAEEGAGIQLGPNGVRVLQRLGLAEGLRPAVGEPHALHVRDGRTGRTLAMLPLGRWISARHGAPYWTVHRRDLQEVLQWAASAEPAIALRTGFEVVTVTRSGEVGLVQAISKGGDVATGSALVGADGLWSSVRPLVCPMASPQFVGATATRTVVPSERAGGLAGPDVGLWLGPDANIVHYPVRGGAEVAVVVIAAEDWQGRDWDADADTPALAERIGRFHATLAEPLGAIRHWRKWALYRLAPLRRWSVDRITLIGDAAHPMLPHLAQGGVLALEDAVVLADCLAARPGDERGAFRSFEAKRRRRARRVQAASLRQGRIYHLPPPLSLVRDAVLRAVPGSWLMASYDWLYGWRTDGDV